MAENGDVFDLYGNPYVHDPANVERSTRGAALCRATLATNAADELIPLDADPIRDRALRRARTERAAQRRRAA